MGEQFSKPSIDVGSPMMWNIQPTSPTTHHTKVDENWPGNTSDYIHETVIYQNDAFGFPADGPTAMNLVHTIHFDFYLNTTNITQIPGIILVLYIGAAWYMNKSWNCDTGGVWLRKRFTFTGLNLTKTQYNQLSVHILTAPGDPGWPVPEIVP